MSDLSIYELEDIIWDDFDRSGDHIVPHPNSNDGGEDKREGATCNKKPRHEPTPLQIKEERDLNKLNKEPNMMEKDSWGGGGVFAASGDSIADTSKDMPSSQSGDAKIGSNVTSGSELCTDDGIGKDNSYNYPSSHNNIRQPDHNLFSNDCNDKESSDLLYYGWPDIGNFDDMDRMLSNCDSSFGLGVTGNDDELVWFTSEDPSRGYEDMKFPCTEETNGPQDNKRSRILSESKENKGSSVNYLQNTNYLQPGGAMMTGANSNNKGPTPAPSSNESSQVQSMEGYGEPLLQGTSSEIYGRFQTPFGGKVSSQKQFYVPEKKIESQSQSQNDVGGVKKKKGSLVELDVPEGSSISTELNEISLEATSFRQLQQVMEQLDLRTKLCIRDSLYRLARSAEQRHNHAGITDPTNPGGPLMTDGTNNGFMDMETDTNPIDRTIAHLLFHRPSESFSMPTTPSPLKPNAKETRNESDDKVSSSGKN